MDFNLLVKILYNKQIVWKVNIKHWDNYQNNKIKKLHNYQKKKTNLKLKNKIVLK